MTTTVDTDTDIEAGKSAFFAWLDAHIDQRVAADLAVQDTGNNADSNTGSSGNDEQASDTTAPADEPPVIVVPPVEPDPAPPVIVLPVDPPPVIVPPVEPVPAPPKPKPAPAGFRLVNGRQVPLNLYGFAPFVKTPDLATAMGNVAKIEAGLYQPGHKAKVIGVFIGLDDPRCVSQKGFSIPGGLFDALTKAGYWIEIALPTIFRNVVKSGKLVPNNAPTKFLDAIGGICDATHRAFAQWCKASGGKFILRLGWERPADWMPHGISDKAGNHYDYSTVVASQHHVMDVLESEWPGQFLYSDSHFRVPFIGNGAGKTPTIIDPALVALDPKRVHMAGADIYPGGWSPTKQTLDKFLDYEESIPGNAHIPASLMAWGRWAKARGLPLCIDEMGALGRPDAIASQFFQGIWGHLQHNLPAEKIDVCTAVYYHGDTNKIVGNPAYVQTLATMRSTFGSAG